MASITLDTNGTLAKDGVEDNHAFLCSIMADKGSGLWHRQQIFIPCLLSYPPHLTNTRLLRSFREIQMQSSALFHIKCKGLKHYFPPTMLKKSVPTQVPIILTFH